MINRKLFFISLIVILVAGLSTINASEIQDQDTTITEDQSVVTDNQQPVSDYQSDISDYSSKVINKHKDISKNQSENIDKYSEDTEEQSEVSVDKQDITDNTAYTPKKSLNKKEEINTKEEIDSLKSLDDLNNIIANTNLTGKVNEILDKLHSSIKKIDDNNNFTFTKSNTSNVWTGTYISRYGNVTLNTSVVIDDDAKITKIYGLGWQIKINNTNLKVINSSYESEGITELIISRISDPTIREIITNRTKDIPIKIANITDNINPKIDNATKTIDSIIDNATKNIDTIIDNGTKTIKSIISNVTKNIPHKTNITNIIPSVINNTKDISSTISNITGDIKAIISDIHSIISSFRHNVTVKVDPINGIIGEKITLNARVTDVNGTPVNGGNLVFKLNGKTLKTNGRFNGIALPQKFQVKNGIAKVTIIADSYLRNIKNLTASYSGNLKYNEAKSKVVKAQIKKRNAQITVTASPSSQKQYETITFTAKLKDTTSGHKNDTAMSTNTRVLFKVNGKTIKNILGQNVLVKVVNNTATYKYQVPAGMGGITKDGKTRKYTVTAVLVSDSFYPNTRKNTTFGVQRSPVTISLPEVKVTGQNKLTVQTNIKDYKGKNVVGTNRVAVKINGITYTNSTTNKKQVFTVTNGIVNIKNIPVSEDIKIKTVSIVTGARQAYLGQRNQTSTIKKVLFVL